MGTVNAGVFDNLDQLDSNTAPLDNSGAGADANAAPDQFQSAAVPPLISFRTQGIDPPSDLYVTIDDQITFTARNLNPAVTKLQLNMRLLRPDGLVYSEVFVLNNVPSDGSNAGMQQPLAEGFLLAAAVMAPGINTQRGQSYVTVGLLRGVTSDKLFYQDLISDYIANGYIPSWPTTRLVSSIEGRGHIRTITGTQPAAGADIHETVPANRRWRLVSFRGVLTTSAFVGNRNVSLSLDDAIDHFFAVGANVNQPASKIYGYNAAPGCPVSFDPTGTITLPAPLEAYLIPGMVINLVGSLDAADQWSAPQYVVEEWVEG